MNNESTRLLNITESRPKYRVSVSVELECYDTIDGGTVSMKYITQIDCDKLADILKGLEVSKLTFNGIHKEGTLK